MQLASSGLPTARASASMTMPQEHVRPDAVHGERAVRARGRDRARAHDRRHAARRERARAPRAAAAVGVRRAEARAERVGDAQAAIGAAARREQVQAVVHLVASSVPELGAVARDGRRSRPARCSRRVGRRAAEPHELAVRIPQADRGGDRSASRRCSARSSARSARAQRDRRSSTSRCTEQTRESFDPAVQVVRSEQTNEDSRRGEGVQGRARCAEQSAASSRAANARSECCGQCRRGRRSGGATKRVALGDPQLRARQDREPHAAGRSARSGGCRSACSVDNKPAANGRGAGTPLAEQELASLTSS